MSDLKKSVFPHDRAFALAQESGEPIMLEGMKVLFDEKVGLYPVDLEAKPAPVKRKIGFHNGRHRNGQAMERR